MVEGCWKTVKELSLLRVCVHSVCVFTAVCIHFGWVNCRAQIPSMSQHTWPYKKKNRGKSSVLVLVN